MRWRERLNPFSWSQKTIYIFFGLIFAFTIPLYLFGFSAFASPVMPQNASLRISAIGIFAPVSPGILNGKTLEVPNSRIASYTNGHKVFLYAHNTGIFQDLNQLKIGDKISYIQDNTTQNFTVSDIQTLAKQNVNMGKLLTDTESSQLILMTCAGQKIDDDYIERLIIYAE